MASDCLRSPQVSPFHSQSKFLKIISDEDVMEDQIYVLPEKWITIHETNRPFNAQIIIMVYERKHCGCGLEKQVNINKLGVGR